MAVSRILVLSFISLVPFGASLVFNSITSHPESKGFHLIGRIDGVESDGVFDADVKFVDPGNGKTVFTDKSRFEISNGLYRAEFGQSKLQSDKTYQVEINGLDTAEDLEMIDFVELQPGTPGTVQTGHLNISGYILAGRIGLGVSPTIARVQVNESGTAQGVRSITNTGTAVYGQATAGTGLAAGGYFTTSSVGGRAMVGDALSTTGSTVGGLFYNRSDAGVAIWGRHIKNSGAAIGVYGQTASSGGTAIVAENSSNANSAYLAGPGGSLVSSGTLPRHFYNSSTAATMVPIAYGHVSASAAVLSSDSGNVTVENIGTGQYVIDVLNYNLSTLASTCVTATPASTLPRMLTVSGSGGTGDFRINTFDVSGTAINVEFAFVVYRNGPVAPVPGKGERIGRLEGPELTLPALPIDMADVQNERHNRPRK